MKRRRLKIKRRKHAPAPPMTRTKARYRLQPQFKDDMKAASRKAYRSTKGAEFELEGNVVLRSLEFVDNEAVTLPVVNQLTADTEIMPVVRLTRVAQLLNTSYQTLWRWTTETQQAPSPVLIDTSSGREYGVYHVEEVRIMIRVIGEHLRAFRYYRKDHDGPRERMFSEIEALRAVNFNQEDDTTHASTQKRSRTRRKARRK